MRAMKSLLLVFGFVAVAAAQSPEPPLSESRLTVHTLLREDVFAGFMANDMVRFARAERNIEQLLRDRPGPTGESAGMARAGAPSSRRARARSRQGGRVRAALPGRARRICRSRETDDRQRGRGRHHRRQPFGVRGSTA